MSDKEKGKMIADLAKLEPAAKNFVLGFMAGQCESKGAVKQPIHKEEEKKGA